MSQYWELTTSVTHSPQIEAPLLNAACDTTLHVFQEFFAHFYNVPYIKKMICLFHVSSALLGVLVLYVCFLQVLCQPDGWKMTDRFYGFRYEITPNSYDSVILQKVLSIADDYSCFGWVQESPAKTIVGEARCSKARGPIFQEKLEKIEPNIKNFVILVSCLYFLRSFSFIFPRVVDL
jgi:hypothetical protein